MTERGRATAWLARVQAEVGELRLDVELRGGERPLALIGPNGSGKTTLLRVIAGAVRPRAGRIEVGGRVLYDSARGVEVPIEARRVGYVPQGFGLLPHLRVRDNVAFGLSYGAARRPRPGRATAALAMLAALDCAHLADRFPAALSGGEQQRVALARALIIEPAILLLDEPLSAMDAAARRRLRGNLAARLSDPALPSIVVTHDRKDVRALGATVCVLDAGRVVQQGSPDELCASPANAFVAEFFDVHAQAVG